MNLKFIKKDNKIIVYKNDTPCPPLNHVIDDISIGGVQRYMETLEKFKDAGSDHYELVIKDDGIEIETPNIFISMSKEQFDFFLASYIDFTAFVADKEEDIICKSYVFENR